MKNLSNKKFNQILQISPILILGLFLIGIYTQRIEFSMGDDALASMIIVLIYSVGFLIYSLIYLVAFFNSYQGKENTLLAIFMLFFTFLFWTGLHEAI